VVVVLVLRTATRREAVCHRHVAELAPVKVTTELQGKELRYEAV
jgi:hypothetical protein